MLSRHFAWLPEPVGSQRAVEEQVFFKRSRSANSINPLWVYTHKLW
jgi:hypothetical protein